MRSRHAIGSGGLAVGAVITLLRLPESPLLLLALIFVVVPSVRAVREAFRDEFDHQWELASQIAKARAALDAGNPRRALLLAHATLQIARSAELRQEAWSLVARAGIGARDPFAAHAALQQLPASSIDLHLLASYLLCCNRCLEAEDLLQEARRLGQRSPELSKLLIEVLFALGDRVAALSVIDADTVLLSAHDRQLALLALTTLGEPQR